MQVVLTDGMETIEKENKKLLTNVFKIIIIGFVVDETAKCPDSSVGRAMD